MFAGRYMQFIGFTRQPVERLGNPMPPILRSAQNVTSCHPAALRKQTSAVEARVFGFSLDSEIKKRNSI